MIITDFDPFRVIFATALGSLTKTCTFAATGNILTISGPSGWVAGDVGKLLLVTNAANDGWHKIKTVTSATIVVLDPDFSTVVDETGTTGVSLAYGFYDTDGRRSWPVADVRKSGFDSGITGATENISVATAFDLTADAGPDSVLGTDEYNWYVSQRTDVPADQEFTITQKPNDGSGSYSGVINVAFANQTPGDPLTAEQVNQIFKHTTVYVVLSKSGDPNEGDIQVLNLHRAVTSATS